MTAPIRVEFDRSANAAYIYLRQVEPGGVAKTVNVHEAPAMVNLDFDAQGRLIGIEVLGATKHLPLELLQEAEKL